MFITTYFDGQMTPIRNYIWTKRSLKLQVTTETARTTSTLLVDFDQEQD